MNEPYKGFPLVCVRFYGKEINVPDYSWPTKRRFYVWHVEGRYEVRDRKQGDTAVSGRFIKPASALLRAKALEAMNTSA